METRTARKRRASVWWRATVPSLARAAASMSPLESHQLGSIRCSVIESREKACSNQAADIASARGEASAIQARPIIATRAAPTAIERAWSRSRGIHATSAMQTIPPSVAGMATNATMKGMMSTKNGQGA